MAGRDKGLVSCAGKLLIEHALNLHALHGGRVFISCNRNTEQYAAYAPIVTDLRSNYQGPLAGLEAAAAHIATPFLFVTPCDTPHLPRNLQTQLLEALVSGAEGKPDIAYANDGDRDHYLCAVLRTKCLSSLPEFLDNGGRAVRHWYSDQGAVAVSFSKQADQFANYNQTT